MNSLTITQKTSETERYIPNEVITTLYDIGKDDDENQTLTSGVDTTDSNRPVTSVVGSVAVRVAYANQINYLATKFPNLNISTDATYIYFKDTEVERVLLTAGIGDGTGITPQDAANANIGTIFKNNTTITSFDEFGYFNRANTSPTNEMFNGCTNLKQIDLSNIAQIPYRAFYNCSNLEIDATNLSQSIISVGQDAFRDCSKMTGDINLPSLSTLGNSAFTNCYSIDSVTDLGSITSIPYQCFINCTNMKRLVIPNTCSSLGNNALDNCGIEQLTIPVSMKNAVFRLLPQLVHVNADFENWDEIPKFCGCPKVDLGVLYQPNVIYAKGGELFGPVYDNGYKFSKSQDQFYFPGMKIHFNKNEFYTASNNFTGWLSGQRSGFSVNIVYLKNIEYIDKYSFCGTGGLNLIINNTTPPKIVDHDRGSGEILLGPPITYSNVTLVTEFQSTPNLIYVPDSAVNTYQTEWPTHATIIRGISSLNNGVIYSTKADWENAGKPIGLIAEYLGLDSTDLATFVSANNLTYYTSTN